MRYTTETMRVVNKLTGRSTYYKRVCDVWRRISKVDDKKLCADSESASCMFTKGAANPKSRYIRHFTTLNYNFPGL